MLAFAHPGLLWTAAGLVTVPILIHYFFRRRHRVVRWAAMEFLLAALRKQKRRMQLENLILLLLRCLAIALFGLALARPAVEADALNPFGGGARALVVVLDTSASMGAETTGRTALDRARAAARTLLAGLPENSDVSVVVTRDDVAGGGPNVLLDAATPAQARERLDKHVALGSGPNDLGEALRYARERLEKLRGRRLVVLVTDLQARDWQSEEGGRREDVRRALLAFAPADGEAVPVVLLDAGSASASNVVVGDFRLEDEREAFAGSLVGLRATFANFGEREEIGTATLFTAARSGGWEKRQATTVAIPATVGFGAPQRVTETFYLSLPRDAEGPARFRVVFEPGRGVADRLEADNTRYLALRVKPPVRFLPVRSFSGALDLLRDTADIVDVIEMAEPIPPEALSTYDLARVDVVLWADAEPHGLDEEGAARLERFVKNGGGLLAYVGESAQPDRINQLFFKERREGLFPALLAEGKPERVADGQTPYEIDVSGAQQHPLFVDTEEFFGSPAIVSFRPVREARDEDVVARYNTVGRDPAVLEHRLGRGRVVVVTTTPDERGFRTNGSILPAVFFFNAAHYLVAEDPSLYNVLVGQPVRIPLAPGARRVSVEPLDQPVGATEEEIKDAAQPFVFDDTALPGFYRFVVRRVSSSGSAPLPTEETLLAAVNLDVAEGDLRRTAPDEVRRLYRGATLEFAADPEDVLPQGGRGGEGELARVLLAAVVGLLFLELFLGWYFGRRRRARA